MYMYIHVHVLENCKSDCHSHFLEWQSYMYNVSFICKSCFNVYTGKTQINNI